MPQQLRATEQEIKMYTLNQLTILSLTGNEADIHYTTNGTLVATLSVATKQSWKDAEGA